MPSDGIYFNDVTNTKVTKWNYKVSISRIGNHAKIMLANPGGIANSDVTFFDDLKIYSGGGILAFRGRIHNVSPTKDGSLEITAYGYIKDLVDRFANESYTNKSSSFIVNALVTGYSSITGTNIATTTDTVGGGGAYLVKATSVFDEILKLADALNFDFWVDTDNDFHFQEQNYASSGISLDYTGGGNILSVDVPKQGTEIYNRIEVRGNSAGSPQPVAMIEDKASQDNYGVVKDYPTIFDNSLLTVADCQAVGQGIMDKFAWVDPVITIEVFGQDGIIPGTTIALTNFSTNFDIDNGTYLILERSGGSRGIQTLKIAQYNSTTEDMLADIIRRMRKQERVDFDHTASITKFLRFYEDVEFQGYTLKMISQTIGQSFITGHSTNGVAGNTTDNIVTGLSGRTLTTEIDKTIGIGGVES